MKNKKNIRANFRNEVFKRDNYTCQICGYGVFRINPEEEFDAHHITDRKEMPNGGYVKENGITVCKKSRPQWRLLGTEDEDKFTMLSCHMRCEKYHISGGNEFEKGLQPDDLYKIIKSSKELAIKKSKLL